jgi:chromosome segregation ATPase
LAQIKRLKRDLITAKQQTKETEVSANDARIALRSDHDRLIANIQTDHQAIQKQLNDHIQKLNRELATSVEIIATHEQTISKLQKSAQVSQDTIAEQSDQITATRRSADTEIARLTAQARLDRENSEATVADLTRQVEGLRASLAQASDELAQSESRRRQLKKGISSLKEDGVKLEREIREANEKAERDAAVNQAMVKNAALASESTWVQRIQDLKAKHEADKRKLIAMAADEFRAYFNASDAMNEDAYRNLLHKVRMELRRLADSEAVIRRLVGANPRQPTDDAVAQYVKS